MYFGSVRFFKHRILLLIVTVIGALLAGCILLGVKSVQQKEQLSQLFSELELLKESVHAGEDTSGIQAGQTGAVGESPDYCQKYPDMAVQAGEISGYEQGRLAYLTFDDGPSENTTEILRILQEHGVKATFFIVGNQVRDEQGKEWLRQIAAEGHTLAIHSYSHDYERIYASTEAFLDDFYQAYSLVEEVTGQQPRFFRFPGGSINAYNTGVYQQIIAEMGRRGFTYFDWNVSAQDAARDPVSSSKILVGVLQDAQKKDRAVVLMHDSKGKETTVAALAEMIEGMAAQGYEFRPITDATRPMFFQYQ